MPTPKNVTRYVVDHVWSTSSLALPPLQGVRARPPAAGDLIESMDGELVVLHLTNSSGTPPGRTRALLILSTDLSTKRGGAPLRQLSIQMRPDVTSTKPLEPDFFQGWGDLPGNSDSPPGLSPTFFGRGECFLSWWGGKMPLKLAGGSIQLVTYTMMGSDAVEPTPAPEEAAASFIEAGAGRRPPRRAR